VIYCKLMDLFSSSFFAQNRKRLQQHVGSDALIIITANALLQRRGDTTFSFDQEPNFWYLIGINTPEATLVIDGSKEFLILPQRTEVNELFAGAIDGDAIAELSGVTEVLSYDDGWRQYAKLARAYNKIATISQNGNKLYDDDHEMFVNPAQERLYTRLVSDFPDKEIQDISSVFATMRQIKQAPELTAIRQACSQSGLLFDAISRQYRNFTSEHDIQRFIEIERAKATLQWAYDPIVASGQHANTLHYIAATKEPLNEITLFDIGYQYQNYAADISRTYSSRDDEKYNLTHAAVKEVYDAAVKACRPGATRRDIEMAARQKTGDVLEDIGLVKKATPEVVAKYFPHALGHHVGLEVHDVNDLDAPLTENMVMTIEPGLYIPEWGFGVRYENTVLVTSNGIENLCADAPDKAAL
jgi:Xaa-Pro aminopeptidase